MFTDITWAEGNDLQRRKDLVVIDVRSPGEFEEARIPGSLNIPLFDNGERAEVGTLYTQVSVEAAKERGLEIVSAKLPAFIKQFSRIKESKAVYCWRGGMRSRTTATLLSLMGIHCYRLNGGYRAYRQWVLERLETFDYPPLPIVLHGNTGTGKTEILRRLKQDGQPAIDLEDMAGHRGSIFGDIGLRARNQKMFDSLLVDAMESNRDERYIYLEAESKRIGKAVLPEGLMLKRREGFQIKLVLPLEERVRQILRDYDPAVHGEACYAAFRRIRSRIHTPIAAEIDASLRSESYERAVELLLAYYYDPLYEHSSDFEEADDSSSAIVEADTVDDAYRRILELAGRRFA